jgi:glucose/arabinose dehydrogenase
MIYWSYAQPRAEGTNGTAVARGRLSEDASAVTGVQAIFRQRPAWASTRHFGSRLVWDNKGHLYVTLGERSLPEPRLLAQNLGTHIGKVVRINADGSVPEDNPFVGRESVLPEIWSYGHRNIQGAALHPETGVLWTIEHGPRGGDELNHPLAGLNYGWPVITYGEDYSGAPIGAGVTAMAGMEQPVYYWDPVIAPSGMLFYQGDLFDGWQGDLVIASLRPGALVRLKLEGGRVTGEERLLTDVGRVRDVAEGPDGALWVVTDETDGQLLKVTPAS